jgi:hypothetical protein
MVWRNVTYELAGVPEDGVSVDCLELDFGAVDVEGVEDEDDCIVV